MSIQAVAWVLDYSESRGLARLVLISLANHASKETGECWPTMRTIAKEAGVAVRTVHTRLKDLEALGEVEIVTVGGPRRSTIYRLTYVSPAEHKDSGYVSPGERSVSRSVIQNHHEPKTSPNGDGELFEAFYEFWTAHRYTSREKVPKSERGRLNAAVKEAKLAGISADEVRVRGKRYVEMWREMERTPQALLANWHRFEPMSEVTDCGECGNRGLIWVGRDGQRTTPDDPDADTAVPCPSCAGDAA